MAVGTSGVAGSPKGAFGDLRLQLDLVSNVDLYQQRLATLEDAEKRANEAKSEAGRLLKNARNEAEEAAKKIIAEAEEQAEDRLNAIQDLEAKFAADKKAWEEEKSSEQTKLRSDRSRSGAATRAANEAKEQADEAKKSALAREKQAGEERAAFVEAAKDIREVMKRVGV